MFEQLPPGRLSNNNASNNAFGMAAGVRAFSTKIFTMTPNWFGVMGHEIYDTNNPKQCAKIREIP